MDGMNRRGFVLSLGGAVAARPDWPQWAGPTRNFVVPAVKLATSWPEGGPKRLWTRDLGEGYSGIAESGGVLYTMYRRGVEDVVVAIAAATGKTIWEYAYAAPKLGGQDFNPGPGPHAMPLLAGDRLFAAGATGIFHCLEKKTGRKIWAHSLIEGWGGSPVMFGYSCNPMPYKDTVIMLVGGRNHSLVAFRQSDGTAAWQAQNFANSNSSPVLIQVDGQDQIVAFMTSQVIGVDPNAGGALLWTHKHTTQYGLAVSMPVWGPDNLLFFSSSYEGGSRCLKLTRDGPKTEVDELWHNNRVRIHFGSIIRVGDVIYGSSGHSGPCFFTALDVKTGKILWQDRTFAKATFLMIGDRFLILDEDGTLALATPAAEGLTIHCQASILVKNAWTIPTLVGTKIYVRDRKVMMALELS